jgi:hypothetical protein
MVQMVIVYLATPVSGYSMVAKAVAVALAVTLIFEPTAHQTS